MTAGQQFQIRPEAHSDADTIRVVLRTAFGRELEARLVEQLRDTGELVSALVAERKFDGVLGYVAFARLRLETGKSEGAIALAPLAVMPGHQNRGVGSALVRGGLGILAKRDERLVFVLGNPAYYSRFGFRAEIAASFRSPYGGPHFMALRLAGGAPTTGRLSYPAPFNQLS